MKKVSSKWLIIKEAAEYLRCSERYLREMVSNRQIPHTIFAGKVLFHQDKLDELLLNQEITVEPQEGVCQKTSPTLTKERVEIRPDCDRDKVNTIIKEFIDFDEHFVSGLAINLKKDLEKLKYHSLSPKVYAQLSRWCWPKRQSSREKWVQPKAHELSKLLFGKIIERTRHPSYRS